MTKLRVGFVSLLLFALAVAVVPRVVTAPKGSDLRDGEILLEAILVWKVETPERVDAWIFAEVGIGTKAQQDAGIRSTPYKFTRLVQTGDPLRLRVDTAGWYAHILSCRAWTITNKSVHELMLTKQMPKPGSLLECRGVVA